MIQYKINTVIILPSKQELYEIQQNLAKPLQKAKQLTCTPRLKQVVRFLEDVERWCNDR